MEIFEKFWRFLGFSGEEEEKEVEQKEIETSKTVSSEQPKESPKTEEPASNIMNFDAAASNRENPASHTNKFTKNKPEIKIIKPKGFSDAQIASNFLRNKIAVVVNFEDTETAEATRILDFIAGTVYAIDGKVKPIGNKVFFCAHDSVIIDAYEEEIKNKTNFFE